MDRFGGSFHTPGASTFVCQACRRGACGRCILGRCTCDHEDAEAVAAEAEAKLAAELAASPPPRAKAPRKVESVPRASPPDPAEKALRARRQPGRKAAPEAHRRLVVEDGVLLGVAKAALKHQVSENTVRRWGQELQVLFPPSARDHKYPLAQRAEAVQAAHALGSARAASRQFGIPANTIIKWARAQGRPLKGRTGPRRQPKRELPGDQRLTKEAAPCCLARALPDGRPVIGYCGPDCVRRPAAAGATL